MSRQRRWLRLDMDWEDSAWLDSLDGTAAGCWPRVLCWVKRSGTNGRCKRPETAVLCRRWRVPREAVESLIGAALMDGAMRIEDGDWIVVNWSEYQDVDPTATERKRRQRERESESDAGTSVLPLPVTPIPARHA